MSFAELYRGTFFGSDLAGTDLSRAGLLHVDFTKTNLVGPDLSKAETRTKSTRQKKWPISATSYKLERYYTRTVKQNR